MEGMLEKEMEEVIVGNAEVREVFKISKNRNRGWLYGYGWLRKTQQPDPIDPRRYCNLLR